MGPINWAPPDDDKPGWEVSNDPVRSMSGPPRLRVAAEGEPICDNCRSLEGRTCSRYGASVQRFHTCDSFEPNGGQQQMQAPPQMPQGGPPMAG